MAERAKAAADYAESWIWIWNCRCRWMRRRAFSTGRKTCRLQGFKALRPCTPAARMSIWIGVPSYAKLYNYTKTRIISMLARVLLHDTNPWSPFRDASMT